MKEFKAKDTTEPVEFKIGNDVFVAVAPSQLPANVLMRYADSIVANKTFAAHVGFFADVLDEKTHELFIERMDSKENPITISTMADVVSWLIEEVYSGKAKGLL